MYSSIIVAVVGVIDAELSPEQSGARCPLLMKSGCSRVVPALRMREVGLLDPPARQHRLNPSRLRIAADHGKFT